MKQGVVVVSLAMVGMMLWGVPVRSQDLMIVMEHKDAGPHERPLVQFNHEKHSSTLECLRCHHDFDQFGNNRGGEDKAQPCAGCHNPSAQPKKLPLKEAFHAQCKGCHESMGQQGRKSGPVTCGECHVRK
jgi:predicted CXXCH cytochrome family protein